MTCQNRDITSFFPHVVLPNLNFHFFFFTLLLLLLLLLLLSRSHIDLSLSFLSRCSACLGDLRRSHRVVKDRMVPTGGKDNLSQSQR